MAQSLDALITQGDGAQPAIDVGDAIVFTQGHPDHVGGWSLFNGDGVETIAQANHPDVREYWRNLHPFYVRRIARLWGQVMDVDALAAELPPEAVLTTSFIDSH